MDDITDSGGCGEAAGAAWPSVGPDFQVTALIGSGGMGAVYRARDLRLSRDVAVKLLSPALAKRDDVRARFVREARTLAACNHPNIVQIHACSAPEAAIPFLVMELVSGPTLQEVLERRGPAQPEVGLAVAAQLLEGLETVHARGVIHRDIKPGNVLFHDGVPKLADFGVAHVQDGTSLTVEGRLVGTVRYLPPEAFSGARPSVQQDVYSVGCLLYELLTGHAAFPQETTAEVMAAICRGDYVPTAQARPELPGAIAAAIDRALFSTPAGRYQSAGEMADACRALLAERGPFDPLRALRAYVSGNPATPVPPARTPTATTPPQVTLSPGPEPATPSDRQLGLAHGAAALLAGALLTPPILAGRDGGGSIPACASFFAVAAAAWSAGVVGGERSVAPAVTGAMIGIGFLAALLWDDRGLLAQGAGRGAPALALALVVTVATGALLASRSVRVPTSTTYRAVALGAALVCGLPLAWDYRRATGEARALSQTEPGQPVSIGQVKFARHEGLVLSSREPARGSWLGLLKAGLDPVEPLVKAPLPSWISTALHLAAADADREVVGEPLAIYDERTMARLSDLKHRMSSGSGVFVLEAPAEELSSDPVTFVRSHTALMKALLERIPVRVAVLPALSVCAYLRGARPRATRAELVARLAAEAAALKAASPGVEIGIQETTDPDESLLAELAGQPWVDWVIARPPPGTVPTAALDETLGDLRQLGAAAKMGLLTYMPFGGSQYWSWHEEPHGELVALAARYISSRKLRGWVHAPVWSHREYGFRVIDRVPPVRSTAPRRELERFLAR